MNTPDISGVVRSAIHNSGGIKKSLLTPCRRIGLSRKRKNQNTGFNSPLSQENIDLNCESPVESRLVDNIKTKTLVTPLNRSKKPKTELKKYEDKTPDTMLRCKNNLEDGSSKLEKSKERNKIVEAKSHRKTKKKLILESDSDEENAADNPLNMSGCELFTKEDIEPKKSRDKLAIKEKTEIKPVVEDSKKKIEKLEDKSVINLADNKKEDVVKSSKRSKETEHRIKPQEIIKPKGKKKLIIESDEEGGDIDDPVKKYLKEEQKLELGALESHKSHKILKTYSRETSAKSSEKSKTISDKKVTSSSYNVVTTMSPKTIQSLETEPLLFTPDLPKTTESSNQNKQSSYHISSKPSELKIIVNKTTIDNYMKKKGNQKSCDRGKLNSKLSTKKTPISEELDSDEEFFKKKSDSSNNLENPKEKSTLLDKIMQIEKSIKDKEIQLEKFKQAEVYHKLHNVQDLTTLTELWKGGCKNALQDLLAKLREHANINMEGLLQKLGAPKTLIKYDTENDCFL